MKGNVFVAALALAALLTACGGPDTADPGPSDSDASPQGVQESQPAEESGAQTPGTDDSAAPAEGSPSGQSPVGTTDPGSDPSEEPEEEALSGTMPLGEPVDEEWFADAVFLGDSRTDGLMLYSGIKDASFLSYKGLSVFTIDDKECIDLNGKTVTVLDALSQQQYAKVYVMLGINELGYPSTDSFKEAYLELVDAVRACQPEADIYLQTQPPVNAAVAAQKGMSDYINNDRIQLFNSIIREVAQEKDTALVDVWEAYTLENGDMPADLTSDGVHMKRAGYEIWYDYLRTHTGTTQPAGGSGESVSPQSTPAVETALPADSPAILPAAGDGQT